jgi:hypothetical protein
MLLDGFYRLLDALDKLETKIFALRFVIIECFGNVALSLASEDYGMFQGCGWRERMRRLTSSQGAAVCLSRSIVFRRSRTVSSTGSVSGISACFSSVAFMLIS